MRAQTNEKSNAYREVIYPYQRLIAWKNWLNVLNNYTAQVAAGKTDYSLSDMRTAYLQQLSSQLNNTDKIKQVLADTNQTEEALLKILTEKINQAKEKVVAAENKLKSRSYLKTILSLICEHPEFLSGKNAFILCEEGHRTKKQNAFTLNNTMLSIFSQATGIVFLLSECFLQYTVGSRSFMVASSFKTLLSSQNLMRLALFNLPKAHEHHDVSLFMMIKQYAFFINMLIFVGAYLLSEGFNKQSLSKGASTFLWIEACQYFVGKLIDFYFSPPEKATEKDRNQFMVIKGFSQVVTALSSVYAFSYLWPIIASYLFMPSADVLLKTDALCDTYPAACDRAARAVLNVSSGANKTAIKSAAKQMFFQCHPDSSPVPSCPEASMITNAKEVLLRK